jgi:hypothetical protein
LRFKAACTGVFCLPLRAGRRDQNDLGGRGVGVVEGKHRRDAITVGYRPQ